MRLFKLALTAQIFRMLALVKVFLKGQEEPELNVYIIMRGEK